MSGAHQEYIIEYYRQGRYIRVSAVDPISYREVSIVGDPATPQAQLARLAVQKLEYVLEKEKRG
jgi:hypothetical protein